MKKIINTDIVFDVIFGLKQSQINKIKDASFSFYTNKKDTLNFSMADITNEQIVIEWSKIAHFTEGELFVDYTITFESDTTNDNDIIMGNSESLNLWLSTGII